MSSPSVMIYVDTELPDLQRKIEYLNTIDPSNFGGITLINGHLCIPLTDTDDPVAIEGMINLASSTDYKKSQLHFPRQRLSLNHVMEGRLMPSGSPLLDLPIEILTLIIEQVEVSDLPTLGRSNQVLQQIARSYRSRDICLDYGFQSIRLLIDLYIELKERASGVYGGLTKLPSRGISIRGIRLVTDVQAFSSVMGMGAFIWNDRRTDQRFINNVKCYYEFYLKLLGQVISYGRTMPSLEFFEWADNTSLSTPFITALANSGIKHLVISHPFVADNVVIDSDKEWPLEDLRIDLRRVPNDISQHNINGTSALCASILYRCAPTLKNLIWKTTDAGNDDPQSFGTDMSTMPYFARLQKLELDESVMFADPQTLNTLLQPPLRYLVANTYCSGDLGAIKTRCFLSRGCISSLETFVWTNADLSADHALDFLRNNSQLSRLSIPQPVPQPLLEERLLPLLSMDFRLTSLDISWKQVDWRKEGRVISASALQIIGKIRTLEQLQISVYDLEQWQDGWHIGWIPDHNVLRENLSSLYKLKKFSLVRDVFLKPGDWMTFYGGQSIEETGAFCTRYYPSAPNRDLDHMDRSQHPSLSAFDVIHGQKVMGEAEAYAKTFPLLEWMYIGQLQFIIRQVKGVGGIAREPVPVRSRREGCVQLRGEVFGNESGW